VGLVWSARRRLFREPPRNPARNDPYRGCRPPIDNGPARGLKRTDEWYNFQQPARHRPCAGALDEASYSGGKTGATTRSRGVRRSRVAAAGTPRWATLGKLRRAVISASSPGGIESAAGSLAAVCAKESRGASALEQLPRTGIMIDKAGADRDADQIGCA
jgi:hypothetical protein